MHFRDFTQTQPPSPPIGKSLNNVPEPILPTIGWREWVSLPDLVSDRIKAKVDTGARSSSLHASEIESFDVDGTPFIRFRLHDSHSDPEKFKIVESPVIDVRTVRTSSGETTDRPVIRTNINLLGETWPVELTLADRHEMGFRMLLGREAFRGRFLVDSAQSFYNGTPDRRQRR